MDGIYILDEYIISVLFNTKDEGEIIDKYNFFLDKIGKLFDLTIKDYLLSKGVDELRINNMYEGNDDEISKYLQDYELYEIIKNNINQLLKAYYDKLLINLDENKRKEMEEYIFESSKDSQNRNLILKEILDRVKNIYNNEGVKDYSQLEQKEEINNIVINYFNKYNNTNGW